jgi:SAM-dependent methyltransferase
MSILRRLVRRLVPVDTGSIWPPIDYELADIAAQGILGGKVLNAGAGWRDISHLVAGELVNQDLTWEGDNRTNIDIFSPLHRIPVEDSTFDTILCIAVLEHVVNPIEVVAEMVRVLKPGGYLVASVPFLQPEHKAPTDYQRYTRDGLEVLMSNAGLDVLDIRPLFTVYHTLYWILQVWLSSKKSFSYMVLRFILLPPVSYLARTSTTCSDKIASAFRILAVKSL